MKLDTAESEGSRKPWADVNFEGSHHSHANQGADACRRAYVEEAAQIHQIHQIHSRLSTLEEPQPLSRLSSRPERLSGRVPVTAEAHVFASLCRIGRTLVPEV
jgi:hypothetical protein